MLLRRMAEAKTERASEQQLERARARGEFQISRMLCAAAALGGFCWAVARLSPLALQFGSEELRAAFALSASAGLAHSPLDLGSHSVAMAKRLLGVCLLPLAAIALSAALAGLLQSMGLRLGALRLRADRFSPGARLRALTSPDRAWDAVASVVSIVVLSIVVWSTCRPNVPGVLAIAGLPHARAFQALAALLEALGLRLLGAALFLGLLDAVIRRVRFNLGQRRTRRELREEQREQHGDPHVRAERARRMHSASQNATRDPGAGA